MAQVTLEIGGRSFDVTCQDGEESHLQSLALMLDEKAVSAGNVAALTETRMLLFASLNLADELYSLKNYAGGSRSPVSGAPAPDEKAIAALEKLADRAESLASSLE